MSTVKNTKFSRRAPDYVTEELTTVLLGGKSYDFKELFEVIYQRLRDRNAASGGEEMLRLRAYEKLQNLVSRGKVRKTAKSYQATPALQPVIEPVEILVEDVAAVGIPTPLVA